MAAETVVVSWYRPYSLPSDPDGNELFCGKVPVLRSEPHVLVNIIEHYIEHGFIVYVESHDVTRIRLTSDDPILQILESAGLAVRQPCQ